MATSQINQLRRRVVVTGIGVITPSGNDPKTLWKNVTQGISAAAPVTRFDASKLPVKIAAEVKNFALSDYIGKVKEKRLDRTIQFAIAAAASAVRDSGVDLDALADDRVAVIEGTAFSGAASTLKAHDQFLSEESYRAMRPYNLVSSYCGEGSSAVSIALGIEGPAITCCSGCASGNDAIGFGLRMIQHDEVDVAVAGGSDEIIEMFHTGFCKLGSMSNRNADPQTAMRPFDRSRNGFVLGEGAAFVVLEELSHALARGAKIYAEVAGHGRRSEAYHPTDPHPNGHGYVFAMERSLRNARLHPDSVDYINAHGSATPQNDTIETAAVKRVFGSHASRLAISATKPVTGHMMGAAGAVESIISILSINNREIPPTINLRDPDDGCDLDYVREARPYPVRVAMCVNAGFGGRYSVLLFKMYDDPHS